MKHTLLRLSFALCFLLSAAACPAAEDILTIKNKFCNISEEQPLAVYWYWVAGNLSRDGVVKDLQAMKKAGINRVQIGMIGEGQGTPEGPIKVFSDEWWAVLHQALKTAGELDIDVGLFNCPGWSQSGGPWVTAKQAMRYLDSRKDTVQGPCVISLPKAVPDEQPVKILAFPLAPSKSHWTISGDFHKDKEFHFHATSPVTVRSITLHPFKKKNSAHAQLQVKQGDQWKDIKSIFIDRSNPELNVGFAPYAPLAVSLPETTGKQFRLLLDKKGVVEQIELSDIPVVERYAEKTFAKMWQTPHPMWDAYMWPQAPASTTKDLQKDDIIDLTGKTTWQVPAGEWVILYTQMKPTGTTNAPAPSEATGYETDKMSKQHIRAHFDNYLGKILKRIPAQDRKTLKIVVEDSYETGGQNWTDNLIPDFKKAYGYDPVPFLPVMSGTVVGSAEQSDRFLWDLRRLIADEVSYNYVGGLREVSHEHGLTTWLENYGHWGFPGEFLQYGGQSDEIAGEFWSFGTLGDIENRVASSCGHIYGKPRVWAESFTCGGPDFTQYPGQMKQRGDRFFAEGINATLLHLYIQQPDDEQPGKNAWFGNEFNRHNTWFSQMDIFSRYLKRCNYMLQQGQYVADVAYFIGEDVPKMTGIRQPEIPQGYSYDYINAEILLQASVCNGRLHLPSGMEYSILVLPPIETMRPHLLEKLEEMVSEGLTLLGPAPTRSPSLQGWPEADLKVQALSQKMWQTSSRPYAFCVNYGKGRIYRNVSLEQVFRDLHIVPDFAADDPRLPLTFLHRTLDDAEIYFISNQSDSTVLFNGAFRVQNHSAQLWNPLEASTRPLPEMRRLTSTTQLPLRLAPYESAFIVFTHQAPPQVQGQNFPAKQVLTTLNAPWKVTFEASKGGPEKPLILPRLTDWTQSENPAIKYFSGTATYHTSFKLSKLPATPLYIDLGKVMVMARVRINGQEVGGVWTPPYRLDISKAVRKGSNEVEVEVVNCWRNRIIGDLNLPESQRFTHQSVTYLKKDSELQPSGLLGPVEIQTYDYLK